MVWPEGLRSVRPFTMGIIRRGSGDVKLMEEMVDLPRNKGDVSIECRESELIHCWTGLCTYACKYCAML